MLVDSVCGYSRQRLERLEVPISVQASSSSSGVVTQCNCLAGDRSEMFLTGGRLEQEIYQMCDRVCRALPMAVGRIQVECGYAGRIRLMYRGP